MKKIVLSLFILLSSLILIKPLEVGAVNHNNAKIWSFEVRGIRENSTIDGVDYLKYNDAVFMSSQNYMTFTNFLIDNINANDIVIFNLPRNSIIYWHDIGTPLNSPNYLINIGSIYEVYGFNDELIYTGASTQHLEGLTVYIPIDGYEQGYNNGLAVGVQQGYNNGLADGFDNGLIIGYDDGYADGERDGLQSSNPEAYERGYNDGAEESFLGNFDKWIVPAIIVIMFVGGFFAVVRMKRDNQ